MMQQITVIGLDSIGCHIASNLARAGYCVTGWNPILDCRLVRQAAAAEVNVIPNLADALNDADNIFIHVDHLRTLESVLFRKGSIINKARVNALIVNFSTISVTAAREIAHQVQIRGLRFINASIDGDETDADSGNLTLVVRGNTTDFDECYALFQAISKSVIYNGALVG